ncbi:MAG: methylmalonyl-CoA mutase subunit beta [Alsobacter sp.]
MSDVFSSSFPLPTSPQWRALVDGVLKGKDFDRTLVGRTHDGLRIEPLYAKAEDRPAVLGRAPGAAWRIMARVDHPDPAAARDLALTDLENGATGLALVFQGSSSAHGYGLAATPDAVRTALDGVYLDAGVDIVLEVGPRGRDAAQAIVGLVRERGIDPASTRIRFGLDPLGVFAARGHMAAPWADVADRVAAAATDLAGQGFAGPLVAADARRVHAAGGSEAQEIAFALAAGLAYLRALEAGGFSLEAARAAIAFKVVADADQFLTTAKLRALRRAWARVEAACGLTPVPAFVEVETAWRMMTQRDPWVNLLRQTVAVFAAGIGGADAVTVLPFTQAIGLPDAFARRIARNTQLVLLEEAHLAKVADPAAGSGGIEALTDGLDREAWALLQAIEGRGGLAGALADGWLQAQVATVRSARETAAARRRDPITGTSEFPHLAEVPVAVLPVTPVPVGSGGHDPVRITPLPAVRLAVPFEALRDAAEARPQRPSIFLATLGPLAAFSARAGFARNFYEAGGIAAPGHDGFARADGTTDLEALAAAFRASGARIACLCGSDEAYAAEGVGAAAALKAAGAGRIEMAGRPGEGEAALRAGGIDTFVYVGIDAVAALSDTLATA